MRSEKNLEELSYLVTFGAGGGGSFGLFTGLVIILFTSG